MRTLPGAATLFALLVSLLVTVALTGCGQRSVLMLEESGLRNLDRGNYAMAVEDFEEAVDRSPGRYESRVGLGRAYLAVGKPREAREQLEVAHTLAPERDYTSALLAEAMHRSGDTAAAARFLRERAEERQTPEDWVRYGRFAARTGDADTAERAMLTGARIDRGMSLEPQVALAEFYSALGDETQAIERLRMASWIDPTNERVVALARELGQTPGPTFARIPNERE